MLFAKEHSSVVNVGVVDQDLVYLLVDGLSCCGCISRREACHETDVVIDECLSGKSELAAVSLQLSLRELVIFEDVIRDPFFVNLSKVTATLRYPSLYAFSIV